MTQKYQKIALLFPGQGVQYPGMAKDFFQDFAAARLAFEEADDLLDRPLSKIILNGPENLLKETKNSQPGIYVAGMAMFRVLKELFDIRPFVCAGLSLGEYSAFTATGKISFHNALPLVQHRGEFMNEACEMSPGTMAVVMGLSAEQVEKLIKEVNLPNDLWAANFNCPGQVVISGTVKGIEAGTAAAKNAGAKRVLPLQVHGAFHSGLMQQAQEKLAPYIKEVPIENGVSEIVMNVPGQFVSSVDAMRKNLIEQVTHSVRWEQGIRAMEERGIDLYIEFGPGKTLSGMINRIGVKAPVISIDKVADLEQLSKLENMGALS